MPAEQIVKTVADFVKAVGPHQPHETYRADRPEDRLMGLGCKTCGMESRIAIADFKATGDLPAYEKAMEAFGGVKKK